MWTNGKRRKIELDDEKLNRFGDELLRAFEAGEAEISTAAASPFLYRRIRVRIEAEEQRGLRPESGGEDHAQVPDRVYGGRCGGGEKRRALEGLGRNQVVALFSLKSA